MADFATHHDLDQAFEMLLGDLSESWASADIAYVHDIVSHGEYHDALENLIALGNNGRQTFSPDQLGRLEALARNIGTSVSALQAALHHRRGPVTAD